MLEALILASSFVSGKSMFVEGIFVVHCYKRFKHVDSSRDYYLLSPACASEHCPEKSEHIQFSLMKTFTMNLDFLDYRPSMDHVKMQKFLVFHGIRIFIFFAVELKFDKKEVQWKTSLMSAVPVHD